MADHLHLYDMTGRCVASGAVTRDPAGIAPCAEPGVRPALLDLGFTLSGWNATGRGGFAMKNGVRHIVRIKSDPMRRDMRAGGVTMTCKALEEGLAEVDPFTAWMTADPSAAA